MNKKQSRRKNKISKDYGSLLASIIEDKILSHTESIIFEQMWADLASRINDSLEFDIHHLIINKLYNDDIIKNKKQIIL